LSHREKHNNIHFATAAKTTILKLENALSDMQTSYDIKSSKASPTLMNKPEFCKLWYKRQLVY